MYIRLYKIKIGNGSTENGTVRNGEFLAAIKNRLYLCSYMNASRFHTSSLREQEDSSKERTESFCCLVESRLGGRYILGDLLR